jgi:hypothetical protein
LDHYQKLIEQLVNVSDLPALEAEFLVLIKYKEATTHKNSLFQFKKVKIAPKHTILLNKKLWPLHFLSNLSKG